MGGPQGGPGPQGAPMGGPQGGPGGQGMTPPPPKKRGLLSPKPPRRPF
jgi:hypothetical protein